MQEGLIANPTLRHMWRVSPRRQTYCMFERKVGTASACAGIPQVEGSNLAGVCSYRLVCLQGPFARQLRSGFIKMCVTRGRTSMKQVNGDSWTQNTREDEKC